MMKISYFKVLFSLTDYVELVFCSFN